MAQTLPDRVHRPRDRKQRIVAAASELFRDRGYHNVSLADVAAAVGITAPAVYKHFRNKEELLRLAVNHGLDDIDGAIDEAHSIDEFVSERVSVARERHTQVALWQREARHLPDAQRAELRRRANRIGSKLAALIKADRPELTDEDADLLSWALLSVFASFINHRFTLPRRDFERLLLRLATVVVDFPMVPRRAASRAAPSPSADQLALPRREQLLTSAIKLIDERGFQSVNMTDIGAAVGIAGPSIYKHYPAKTDLLAAALVRGHDRQQAGMTRALARARDPGEALELLLRAEVDFSLEERSLIGILISERDQLPDKDRQRVSRAQRDILDTWVRVLDNAHPGLASAEARITINVIFAVINNLVRIPRLAARLDLPEQLVALSTALLTAR